MALRAPGLHPVAAPLKSPRRSICPLPCRLIRHRRRCRFDPALAWLVLAGVAWGCGPARVGQVGGGGRWFHLGGRQGVAGALGSGGAGGGGGRLTTGAGAGAARLAGRRGAGAAGAGRQSVRSARRPAVSRLTSNRQPSAARHPGRAGRPRASAPSTDCRRRLDPAHSGSHSVSRQPVGRQLRRRSSCFTISATLPAPGGKFFVRRSCARQPDDRRANTFITADHFATPGRAIRAGRRAGSHV